MLLAKAPCGTKIVLAPSLRPRARLRALLRTDPLGHSFDGAGESAGWRGGSWPWRQRWRRRCSEGRHRGRRWLRPGARRWRDGRRWWRRKPAIRARAANVCARRTCRHSGQSRDSRVFLRSHRRSCRSRLRRPVAYRWILTQSGPPTHRWLTQVQPGFGQMGLQFVFRRNSC
jgi:hypothetical protein